MSWKYSFKGLRDMSKKIAWVSLDLKDAKWQSIKLWWSHHPGMEPGLPTNSALQLQCVVVRVAEFFQTFNFDRSQICSLLSYDDE